MKIAIIHDWLVTWGGSEQVLGQLVQLYPHADIYALIDFFPHNEHDFILNKKVTTSFIQKLPLARKKYRSYLPLMPLAIEQFDLSGYDLVISNSHAVAKGVLTNSNQIHISYCYTPMRYAWDLQNQYLERANLNRAFKGLITKAILHYIRIWDLSTVNRVNYFITLYHYIAKRIKKIYGRESTVIYPPVDIEKFNININKEDFYITASRMVPYKRIDLIVEAFSEMPEKRLIVIGDGPDFKKIKKKAKKNIELLGFQKDNILKEHLQKAKAFIFAAEEDFGILPVEAQACGTPVIAFGKGGVLETVVENKTGIFFKEQTINSIIEAVNIFEKRQDEFEPNEIRKNSLRFSTDRFRKEFREFVEKVMEK
jgi:glycosyltransferase involved in cell wall biosynthesis